MRKNDKKAVFHFLSNLRWQPGESLIVWPDFKPSAQFLSIQHVKDENRFTIG